LWRSDDNPAAEEVLPSLVAAVQFVAGTMRNHGWELPYHPLQVPIFRACQFGNAP
jgi:hypothetical protein